MLDQICVPILQHVIVMRTHTSIDKTAVFLTCIPVVGLIASIAYLLWAFNRGFDITDEGYYLLSAQAPQNIIAPANGFFYFCSSRLFHLAGGSIYGFRFLGLLCMIACSLFFSAHYVGAIGRLGLHASRPLISTAWTAMLLLATLCFYAQNLATPGYNLLNLCGILVAAGAFTCAMSNRYALIKHTCLWLVLAGIGTGFCLWTKWPTGIALATLCICSILFWPSRSPRNRLLHILALVFGLLVFTGFMFVFIQTPTATRQLFLLGTEYVVALGSNHAQHPLALLATQFAKFFSDLSSHYKFLPLLFAILPWLCLYRWRNTPWLDSRVSLWVVSATAGVLLIFIIAGDMRGGSKNPDYGLLNSCGWFMFYSLLAFIVLQRARSHIGHLVDFDTRQCVAFVVYLFALPFVFAVGTASDIAVTGAGAAVFIYASTGVCIAIVSHILRNRSLLLLGIACVSLVITSRIMTSGLAPYRLATSLYEQTHPIEVGTGENTILVDPPTAAAIKELQAIAASHDLAERQDLLALMSMPGLVYAMNCSAPGTPWVFGGYSGSWNAARIVMEQVPPERRRDSWLLLSERADLNSDQISALTDRNFPHGYQYLGQIHWPVGNYAIRLYKPIH
jgi:hypothetical protein